MEWGPVYLGQEQAELPCGPWDLCKAPKEQTCSKRCSACFKKPAGFLLGSGGLWEASILVLAAGRHPVQSAGWQEHGVSPCCPCARASATCTGARLASHWVCRENSARPHLISARAPYGHLGSKGKPDPARKLETDMNILCLRKLCCPPATNLHVWFEAQGEEHWTKGCISGREGNWVLLTCSDLSSALL